MKTNWHYRTPEEIQALEKRRECLFTLEVKKTGEIKQARGKNIKEAAVMLGCWELDEVRYVTKEIIR